MTEKKTSKAAETKPEDKTQDSTGANEPSETLSVSQDTAATNSVDDGSEEGESAPMSGVPGATLNPAYTTDPEA